jgi:DNA-binding transcriptional MerR regulator
VKINEVEALVGITKKNIRFYEAEGLLSPPRDRENGYRDYGAGEVAALEQIKLLRKLGLPLEEIRRMQSGGTVADGMRRHLVTLERQQRDLEQSIQLCRALREREEPLAALDAAALLEQMERLEGAGTTFQNKQRRDESSVRYVAPVAVTAGMTLLMVLVLALLVWASIADPANAPPLPMLVLLAALPVLVILGMCLALCQRLREIEKGEEDEARKY